MIQSYIDISKQDIEGLNSAYGNINFLIANKKLRNNIYLNLYSPICEYKKSINEKAFHFRNYFETDGGNKAVIIDLIDDIQTEFFNVVDESNEKCFDIIIYRKFIDEMKEKAEWLRCTICHEKYTPNGSKPFMKYTYRLKSTFPSILPKP